MDREGDATAGALPNLAAVGTLEEGRVPPAVEQQQRLLSPGERRLDGGIQRHRPGHRLGAADLGRGAEIDDLHRRERPGPDSLRKPKQSELALGPYERLQ